MGVCGSTNKKVKPNNSNDWDYKNTDWALSILDCKENIGHHQSPIDIELEKIKGVPESMNKLEFTQMRPLYKIAEKSSIVNNGKNLQITDNWGTFTNKWGQYDMLQIHCHTLSEHTINGEFYDFELHIVHLLPGKKDLAVIGVFFKLGEESEFLNQLGFDNLPTEKNGSRDLKNIDLNSFVQPLLPGGYWSYNGSLTTPPCSENVRWFVLKQHVTMSQSQLDMFKKCIPEPHCNNRPTQTVADRTIRDSWMGEDAMEIFATVLGMSTHTRVKGKLGEIFAMYKPKEGSAFAQKMEEEKKMQKDEEQEKIRKEYEGRENDEELIDAVNKIGNKFRSNKARQEAQSRKSVESNKNIKTNTEGEALAIAEECAENPNPVDRKSVV